MSITTIIANTASTCMACTIPFNITTDSESDTFMNEKPYHNPFIDIKYIVYIENNIKLELPSNKRKYNKKSRGSKIVSKKYKFNKNKEYRKKHNIFQPGRTNCNQRWCLK